MPIVRTEEQTERTSSRPPTHDISVSVPDPAVGGIHLAASSLNLRMEQAPRLLEPRTTETAAETDARADGKGWTCRVIFNR